MSVRPARPARPKVARRPAPAARGGRSGRKRRASDRQLELFGLDHPPLARPARCEGAAPRPSGPAARPTAGVVGGPRTDPRDELFRRLNRLLGGRLASLVLTDNRHTILTVRRPGGAQGLELRLHRLFVGAPEEVLRSVATFAASSRTTRHTREALAVVREHFRRGRAASTASAGTIVAPRPRPATRPDLDPLGRVLDLRRVRDDLNRRYFDGRLGVDITWGRSAGTTACRGGRRARTSSIRLGSYSYEDRLIRIHRVLDDPKVPCWVVESVVHHELLHAALPPVVKGGRRYFHTPEFRRRERLFEHLEKAERWIEEHLPALLEARARGGHQRRKSS